MRADGILSEHSADAGTEHVVPRLHFGPPRVTHAPPRDECLVCVALSVSLESDVTTIRDTVDDVLRAIPGHRSRQGRYVPSVQVGATVEDRLPRVCGRCRMLAPGRSTDIRRKSGCELPP